MDSYNNLRFDTKNGIMTPDEPAADVKTESQDNDPAEQQPSQETYPISHAYSTSTQNDILSRDVLPEIEVQEQQEVKVEQFNQIISGPALRIISVVMLSLSGVLLVISVLSFFSSIYLAGAVFLIFSAIALWMAHEYYKESGNRIRQQRKQKRALGRAASSQAGNANGNSEIQNDRKEQEVFLDLLKASSLTLNPNNVSAEVTKEQLLRELDSVLSGITTMETSHRLSTENQAEMARYRQVFLSYRNFVDEKWLY